MPWLKSSMPFVSRSAFLSRCRLMMQDHAACSTTQDHAAVRNKSQQAVHNDPLGTHLTNWTRRVGDASPAPPSVC